MLAWATIVADDIIRSIVHVLPDRLPDAQRALTTLLALVAWITGIYALALWGAFRGFYRGLSFLPSGWLSLPYFAGGAAPPLLALMYAMPSLAVANSKVYGFVEAVVITATSFDSNDPALDDFGVKQSKPDAVLTCLNLAPEKRIAILPSDVTTPTKVMVAGLDARALAASFKLASCESGVRPDAPKR